MALDCFNNSLIPRANWTVSPKCLAQYAWSAASSAVIQSPVTLDIYGISGWFNVTVPRIFRNSSKQEVIIGEWRAWDNGRSVHINRFCLICCSNSWTAAGGPAIIQEGPLSIARDNSWFSLNRGVISSGVRGTLNMMPGGIFLINCPLDTTTFNASSRENTPAVQAAAYSPKL